MIRPDFHIYAAHAAFWLTFAAGGLAARVRARRHAPTPPPAPDRPTHPVAEPPLAAPNAGLLVAIHMAAFALMYSGIGRAAIGAHRADTTALRIAAGGLVILVGGAIAGWARLAFASWRLRAQLDAGHQLATGGPFRVVRHPIYAALDLLALGTALWLPTRLTWLAVAAMVTGGELRARAEEPLLERAFGDTYRAYRRRTRRFIPGIY